MTDILSKIRLLFNISTNGTLWTFKREVSLSEICRSKTLLVWIQNKIGWWQVCAGVFFFIKAFVFLILHDTLCPKFHIFAQDAAGFKWDIAAGFIRQKMFSGQICLNLHLTMTIHFTSSLLGVAIYLIRAHTPHCTHWLGYALINSDWAAQFALVATGSMLAC